MMRQKPPQPFGCNHGRSSADPERRGRDACPSRGARPSEQLAEEALLRYVEYESWKAEKVKDAVRRADAGEFASDEEMQAVFDRYRQAADASG